MKIAAAANVEIPAYLSIKQKGYSVRWEKETKRECWYAEKNDKIFIADCPIELLGVINVFEFRGENWQASDAEVDEFLKEYKK